jgi:hypothetical protein
MPRIQTQMVASLGALLVVALGPATGRAAGVPAAPAAAPALPPVESPFARAAGALRVGPGEGYLKLGLLLQGWFTASIFPESEALGTDLDATDTFRLRRAEISLKGQLLAPAPVGIGYGLMIDPARVLETRTKTVLVPDAAAPGGFSESTVKEAPGAISALQDLAITVITPYADVSLGQFKIPISYEGFGSSSELLFAERAAIARALGDARDLGVKVEKRLGPVYYLLGLYNGSGPNTLDEDVRKDLAARVELYPLASLGLPGLMVGGAAYMTLRTADARPNAKDRFEADLRFAWDPLLVQAEYIRGRDFDDAGARTSSQGFYVALAGRLTPNVELAGRFGLYDPDTGGSDTTRLDVAAGVHWFPFGDDPSAANLKLDWFWVRPEKETERQREQHQLVLAAQLKL